MGRTGYHDNCGRPNLWSLIPTPITKKEKKANLEEDLLA